MITNIKTAKKSLNYPLYNAIEMRNVSMIFGKFKANDNIDLVVKKNEIHAIIGENGAGKSTLMSILFGLYKPTSGSIMVNGQRVEINSPLDATKLKIGMVHQHFKLVETFSIIDNIILNDEETKYGFIKKRNARLKLQAIMDKYHFHVDLDKKVSQATVAEQQRVEILKILYRDCDILIFDEPSAVLTPQQIEELLKALLNLKKLGKTILIITHKLDELKKIADRGTVIRKGKLMGVVDIKSTSKDEITKLMVGRSLNPVANNYKTLATTNQKPLLIIKNLSVKKRNGKTLAIKNFSLDVSGGEIVAIAGIEGNGQRELINAITGLQDSEVGQIYFNKTSFRTLNKTNEEVKILQQEIESVENLTDQKSHAEELSALKLDLNEYEFISNESEPKNMVNQSIKERYIHGLAFVPQDRHKYGLALDMSIWENMIIQDYWKPDFSKFGFLKFKNIKHKSELVIEKFDVRSAYGVESVTRYMSGGNQQKLVIGRELSKTDCYILVVVQPTRGLDVGAIDKIHQYILEARDMGKAILLVSYELDEILALADRVVVLNNGQKIDDLPIGKVTKQKLGLLMTKEVLSEETNPKKSNPTKVKPKKSKSKKIKLESTKEVVSPKTEIKPKKARFKKIKKFLTAKIEVKTPKVKVKKAKKLVTAKIEVKTPKVKVKKAKKLVTAKIEVKTPKVKVKKAKKLITPNAGVKSAELKAKKTNQLTTKKINKNQDKLVKIKKSKIKAKKLLKPKKAELKIDKAQQNNPQQEHWNSTLEINKSPIKPKKTKAKNVKSKKPKIKQILPSTNKENLSNKEKLFVSSKTKTTKLKEEQVIINEVILDEIKIQEVKPHEIKIQEVMIKEIDLKESNDKNLTNELSKPEKTSVEQTTPSSNKLKDSNEESFNLKEPHPEVETLDVHYHSNMQSKDSIKQNINNKSSDKSKKGKEQK